MSQRTDTPGSRRELIHDTANEIDQLVRQAHSIAEVEFALARMLDRASASSEKATLCPYPISGDDGTAKDCIAKGNCGCEHGNANTTINAAPRVGSTRGGELPAVTSVPPPAAAPPSTTNAPDKLRAAVELLESCGFDIFPPQAPESKVQAAIAARSTIDPLAEIKKILQDACDRSWKDETLLQTANIASNAIYWRDRSIETLRRELAEMRGARARATALWEEERAVRGEPSAVSARKEIPGWVEETLKDWTGRPRLIDSTEAAGSLSEAVNEMAASDGRSDG